MHVRELVEVAGVIASIGPQIMRCTQPLPPANVQQYWATSKFRFERWNRALKSLEVGRRENQSNQLALRATLDEILVSEMLTRVWTAVLVGRDRRLPTAGDEPIARNVLVSHVEVRHRALALLLDVSTTIPREAIAINRLRRVADRWTDVLIGGLLDGGDLAEFAIEAERAVDFAEDLADRRQGPRGQMAWRLTLASLRNSFRGGICSTAANPDANARIAASILGCFPEDAFDSRGVPHSLWMLRLSAQASDAQGMIEDLLRVDSRPIERPAGLRRRG